MDCIFCKVAAGEIPSTLVRKTDRLVVIEDINPQAPVHMLVIPREHFRDLTDGPDNELLGEMLATAADVAREKGFADAGFRTVVNTNEEGGQTVWHLHMHILAGRPLTGKMG